MHQGAAEAIKAGDCLSVCSFVGPPPIFNLLSSIVTFYAVLCFGNYVSTIRYLLFIKISFRINIWWKAPILLNSVWYFSVVNSKAGLSASVCFSHLHPDAIMLLNFSSLIFVITRLLALWKLDVVHSSRKVLRTTALVGKLPMSPVHSLPKGLLRIPGHQPSVLPSSKVYLSPDDHIAYKGECMHVSVFVGWKYVDLVNRCFFLVFSVCMHCQCVFMLCRKLVQLLCYSCLCIWENTSR